MGAAAGARVDPRVDDPLFLLPDPGDGVRLGPLAPGEVADALRSLPAGTWVALSLAPTRRPLRSTTAALRSAGLQDVALHWEAPRRSARTMLVPLDSRVAVLAALGRHEGSRRGRLLARGATALVSIGLVSLVARDRTATGRTSAAGDAQR